MTKSLLTLVVATLLVAASLENADAQRRGGPPGGPPPVMVALDENGDGEISADEISAAADSLKGLDRNGDGKLSEDEIGPPPGPPRGEGVDSGERPGPGPGGPGGPGGPDPGQFAQRIMQADQNGDGKISKEEAPGRMQENFDRLDGDGNGFLTEDEIARMADGMRNREGRGGPPGGAGEGGPGGPPGGGFGGRGGGPEGFVDRLFQFDANGDGNLTREELAKMAESFGGRGPGGEGRAEGGDNQRRRPQRPGGDN